MSFVQKVGLICILSFSVRSRYQRGEQALVMVVFYVALPVHGVAHDSRTTQSASTCATAHERSGFYCRTTANSMLSSATDLLIHWRSCRDSVEVCEAFTRRFSLGCHHLKLLLFFTPRSQLQPETMRTSIPFITRS